MIKQEGKQGWAVLSIKELKDMIKDIKKYNPNKSDCGTGIFYFNVDIQKENNSDYYLQKNNHKLI